MKVAGVSYDINWKAFTKGKSITFVCLDPDKAWQEDIRPVMRRLKLDVVHKGVVDEKTGIRGLRVWRL
jgi:hypothetical protein